MSACDFSGKVVIITGSSSGIGQAAAILFAKHGASVTIHGRSETGLKKTTDLIAAAGISKDRIHIVKGSITDETVLKALIDETVGKFGKIDILINNAGATKNYDDKDDTNPRSLATLNYVLDTNLKAPIALTELAIPYLEKTKGNIINVSSIAALTVIPTMEYYAISKAALDHFARNYAALLSRSGIRVNNLNPGIVETPILSKIGMTAEILTQMKETTSPTPLGRIGTPEEITEFLAFIASDKASYMTGQCISVDGGSLIDSPQMKVD